MNNELLKRLRAAGAIAPESDTSTVPIFIQFSTLYQVQAFLDAETARLTRTLEASKFQNDGLRAEVAELHRQVAILRDALQDVTDDLGRVRGNIMSCGHGWPCGCSRSKALRSINATAETTKQYDNRVKAEGMLTINSHLGNGYNEVKNMITHLASELRSQPTKGGE